ncbi:MAG: efflux RND transporter periplasmic adaptor subunit [Luteolibacter sp.]|uniref:efflux RND transporter periplasmic adaptor subunit n=1 Tax=Luteolibacter sp. TaxID=1962973 RepID=UPI0032640790
MNTQFRSSLPNFAKAILSPLKPTVLPASWLMVALMTGGCSKPQEEDPRLQPQKVDVFKAKTAEPGSRSFTGTVAARVQSDIGFRIGGKILERTVDLGQHVEKGQLLMRLDSVDLDLSLAAQEANVEAARAKYVQAKADEARFAAALANLGAVSHLEYDQSKAALDSANAQLAAAEAQANVSRNSSGYSSLLADADGVVVGTLAEPGYVVAAGQTVIQLAHDGPREAMIHLPEGVRPDHGAVASAQLYGQEKAYPAVLRQLSDAADPASRTYEARFVLDGEAASAPIGSTVSIKWSGTKSTDGQTVVVPVGAIQDKGAGPGVWIVNDQSEVSYRMITIASIGNEEVVVSSGVHADETVVALGPHLLHEGQVVTIEK